MQAPLTLSPFERWRGPAPSAGRPRAAAGRAAVGLHDAQMVNDESRVGVWSISRARVRLPQHSMLTEVVPNGSRRIRSRPGSLCNAPCLLRHR
jgi:hypothetical protein